MSKWLLLICRFTYICQYYFHIKLCSSAQMLNYSMFTLIFAIERNLCFVYENMSWNFLSKFVWLHLYEFPPLYFVPFSKNGYKIKGNLCILSVDLGLWICFYLCNLIYCVYQTNYNFSRQWYTIKHNLYSYQILFYMLWIIYEMYPVFAMPWVLL